MSDYYDEANAPPARAHEGPASAVRTPPPAASPYGYGGPAVWMRPPARWFSETKPFFLTSEFWAIVIGVIALGITAGTSASVDARLFWILTTAMIVGYALSRGFAKAGARSRAGDPREQFDWKVGGHGHDSR